MLRWWARFGAVLRKLFHALSGTLLSALHRCSMLCFRLGRQSIFIEIYANLVGCRRCGKGAVGRLACKEWMAVAVVLHVSVVGARRGSVLLPFR